MHLEEFAQGDSVIHYLDPRVKITTALSFSLVMAVAARFPVLLAGLVAALAVTALTRLPWGRILARLAVVNAFVLFLWLFLPFSHPGRVLFTLGPLAATDEGVRHALVITLKSNAIILAVLSLLSTSRVFALVHALRHLYLPEKLVNLFFFSFRYFQVIHLEYLRLRAAMKVRCFTPGTNLHTYRSLGWLMGMLLVRSFDRSERVYQAMLCRGYQGKLWILSHFHFHGRDWVFLAAAAVFIILLAVAEWTNLPL
ncbi:MAG: cobalt ECF transporter T component CbiQ [Thermodesulfobacteriota bacterium]